MSWIHIQDLIRMIVFAAETPAISGAINASSPQPLRNAEFAESLAHTVNRPALLRVPQFTLRLVLGEMTEFLFDSLRVVPEAAQGQGYAFDHPTLQGALSELVCRSTT
jgi:NAD dependent epimerase/dehydratase family enzyme